MNWLRMALDGYSQIRAEVTGTPAPWDDYWYTGIGVSSASGMKVTPETAKRISTVLACVNKIAKTVAMLPLKVYSEQSDGGKKLAVNHPVYDVLYSKPNDQQTSFEFRQMMQGHLELRGNAYAEIIPGPRGAVDQLVPIHPDRVTPEQIRASGRIRYRYNDPLTNMTRYLAQEQVFHLRNFMDDGVVGQSTIALMCDTIGVAMAAQDYYARFLKNDATPNSVLTGANFKTEQDKKAFRDNWQESQTAANRGKTAVLPSGMDIKTLGISGKDSELLDARKFSRIEICSGFDVPPHLIGETEKTATYASVEQFNIMFATYCILPRLVLWEQAIQRSLIFSSRYFPKFSMGALLRGDSAARASFYKTMVEIGVFSQDDVRIMEDMNPIPGEVGNTYWRPLNWARLDDVSASVQPKNPSDAGEDPTGKTQSELRRQVYAMAAMAAEPCVRKEVNTLRRLGERSQTPEEFKSAVTDFYREHAGFISKCMKLDPQKAREYCERNRDFVLGLQHPVNGQLDALLTFGTQLLGRQAAEVLQ